MNRASSPHPRIMAAAATGFVRDFFMVPPRRMLSGPVLPRLLGFSLWDGAPCRTCEARTAAAGPATDRSGPATPVRMHTPARGRPSPLVAGTGSRLELLEICGRRMLHHGSRRTTKHGQERLHIAPVVGSLQEESTMAEHKGGGYRGGNDRGDSGSNRGRQGGPFRGTNNSGGDPRGFRAREGAATSRR